MLVPQNWVLLSYKSRAIGYLDMVRLVARPMALIVTSRAPLLHLASAHSKSSVLSS